MVRHILVIFNIFARKEVIVEMELVRDRKGNLAAAFAVITLLVGVSIGVLVFSQVTKQANDIAVQFNDSQAQAFINDAKNIGYNSLNLLIIGAIVLAAMVVLGYVSRMGQ